MKTRIFVALAAVVLVLGGLLSARAAAPHAAGVQTFIMDASYPRYRSLRELTAKSRIVVRATASEVQAAQRVIPAGIPMSKLPAHKAAAIGWIETPVTFTVEQVLKGPADLTNSTIVVRHMGGQVGDALYAMEGEPVSTQGGSYLLFLEQGSDGLYSIVGGPAGRYEVTNQTLRALSEEVIQDGAAKQIHGQGAEHFMRNFTQLVRASQPVPEGPAKEGPAQEPAQQPRLENKPQRP
jgi:hypothetical protein